MKIKDRFNGNHDPFGDHGPDLVEYIYGEMDSRSRSHFEAHLSGCDSCAAELASISDARLGVIEWRRSDFDHLSLPEIVIPEVRSLETAKSGFSGLVGSIFSLPLFARAGIGLAAAAVLVGLLLYSGVFETPSPELAANSNQPAEKNSVTPAIAPETAQTGTRPDRVDGRTSETVLDEPAAKHFVPEKAVVKPNVDGRRPRSHSTPEAPDIRVAKRLTIQPADSQRKAPSLSNFDEVEDTTLRLADIFEEIGSR